MLISYNEAPPPAVESCATIRSTGVTRDRLRISLASKPAQRDSRKLCLAAFWMSTVFPDFEIRFRSRRKNSLAPVSIQSFFPLLPPRTTRQPWKVLEYQFCARWKGETWNRGLRDWLRSAANRTDRSLVRETYGNILAGTGREFYNVSSSGLGFIGPR